jgi:hypothetical protein
MSPGVRQSLSFYCCEDYVNQCSDSLTRCLVNFRVISKSGINRKSRKSGRPGKFRVILKSGNN